VLVIIDPNPVRGNHALTAHLYYTNRPKKARIPSKCSKLKPSINGMINRFDGIIKPQDLVPVPEIQKSIILEISNTFLLRPRKDFQNGMNIYYKKHSGNIGLIKIVRE
jgi:hypothetical protein